MGVALIERSLSPRVLAFVLVAGCGGATPPSLTAADIEQSEVLPSGYTSAGDVSAECGATTRWGRVKGEPVANFDCSFERLKAELAAQAARSGASVLAGMRCRTHLGGERSCSATMARSAGGLEAQRSASRSSKTYDEGVPFELLRSIRVDVEPSRASFARRARAASEVGEPPFLPVSHLELGSIRARCPETACEDRALRAALRVAAGGLGVSDLVDSSCGTFDGERQCAATLAASELDPETDPRAR